MTRVRRVGTRLVPARTVVEPLELDIDTDEDGNEVPASPLRDLTARVGLVLGVVLVLVVATVVSVRSGGWLG